MPFTLAHTVAALPLRRSRLVLSALVVGTMAPDLEYFVRLKPGGGWGHTIPGALLLSLPFGLVVLWLFHNFAKAPVVALLPNGVQRRLGPCLQPFQFLGLRRFLLIVLSLLAGIATHIVWDSFTHSHNWVYHHFRFLHRELVVPWFHLMPMYAFLQMFSSVAGVLILGFWVRSWYRATPPAPEPFETPMASAPKALILTVIVMVSLAGGLLRGLLRTGIPHESYILLDPFAADVVVTAVALMWWQLVAWGILMRAGLVESARESELTHR